MIETMLKRFNVKKFCANCVMLAGAVTALTGAAKSVIDLVPSSCMAKKEQAAVDSPAPPPPIAVPDPRYLGKIARGPASVPSLPEKPPVVLYSKIDPAEEKAGWLRKMILILSGPLVLAGGIGLVHLGLMWRRLEKVKKEVVRV